MSGVFDQKEARRRDALLRSHIAERDWDVDGERRLVRQLVLRGAEAVPGTPWLIDVEWEVQLGEEGADGDRGDLLFSDGAGRLSVVEVKRIAGTGKPSRRRRQVEQQADKFASYARRMWPDADVSAWVFTDDPHPAYPDLRPAVKPDSLDFG